VYNLFKEIFTRRQKVLDKCHLLYYNNYESNK